MKLRPTRNRVVIKYTEIKEKSAGGIILPEDSKKQPTTGVVIASGLDDLGEKLNEGDLVLFGKFSGTKVTIQNEDFVIMNYKDIMAVIEK
jgi:chaperonin GroES